MLGRAPIRQVENLGPRVFEVLVRELRTDAYEEDALTLGVTAVRPEDIEPCDFPETIDRIDGISWAVGYDGLVWDGGREEANELDWGLKELLGGRGLRPNDRRPLTWSIMEACA